MSVHTTYGIHYIPSQILSSQHSTKVVLFSMTYFVTIAFYTDS